MKGILCFGDSITFGRGEMPAKGWCGRLKEWFEANDEYNGVYNLGIPGDTSEGLLQRFDAEAKLRIRHNWPGDEYLILIAIGTNDCKFIKDLENPMMSPEQFEFNIKDLIEKAKKFDANLAFIGLPPVDEIETAPYEDTWFLNKRVELFNDIIKECCLKEDIPFLDMFSLFPMNTVTDSLEDGLHPNGQGFDLMFTKIKDFIGENFPDFN